MKNERRKKVMGRKFKMAPLLIAAVLGTVSLGAGASFEDVSKENEALTRAVAVLSKKGIINGVNETQFAANEKVTREQMAAFIYRMKNGMDAAADGENKTEFTDLDDPNFYGAISWASDEGIINGVSQTQFNPDGEVTLQDCYTMLARANGYDMKEALSEAKGIGCLTSESLSYPTGYISIARAKGFDKDISGDLAYTDAVTRGDVAIILNNVLNSQESTQKHVLDGKKVLFIGQSYIYYGRVAIEQGFSVSDEVLERRLDDYGTFHHLCKQNGADVEVTNWTWGGHTLEDMFGGTCKADRGCDGHDHFADLKRISDMKYDYVVITPTSNISKESHEQVCKYVSEIKEMFLQKNPETKFIVSLCTQMYMMKQTEASKQRLNLFDEMEKDLDVIIADWGNLIYDIVNGDAVVENSTQTYNKNSFVVSRSKADGYHPNQLAGYITAQMIYSIITGEKAEGEETGFYLDEKLNGAFELMKNVNDRYKYDNISPEGSETTITGDELTNYPEVFASPTEMLGIQKLIDKYIAEKPYRNR